MFGGHGAQGGHAFAALNLAIMLAEHRRRGGGPIVQRGLDLPFVQRVADANVHRILGVNRSGVNRPTVGRRAVGVAVAWLMPDVVRVRIVVNQTNANGSHNHPHATLRRSRGGGEGRKRGRALSTVRPVPALAFRRAQG